MNSEWGFILRVVLAAPVLFCALLASCSPSSIGGMPSQTAPLYSQAQMMGLEDSDRINRFQRLAAADGIDPPIVEQIYAPAGTGNPPCN